MADLEKTKVQARRVIEDRIAKTQAEAQTRVNDVMMQTHQRIEALKKTARRRIAEERAMVAKLEGELAVKDERLQAALALLEEYGVQHRVTF